MSGLTETSTIPYVWGDALELQDRKKTTISTTMKYAKHNVAVIWETQKNRPVGPFTFNILLVSLLLSFA